MSLFERLQNDIFDNTKDISSVLRRAKVFHNRLPYCALLDVWLDGELEGYKLHKTIPPYRKRLATNMGLFVHHNSDEVVELPIPSECIPSDIQPYAHELVLTSSVMTFRDMLRTEQRTYRYAWPKFAIAKLTGEIYPGYECHRAWKIIASGEIHQTLEQTRTKLLNLLLALEKTDPDLTSSDRALAEVPVNRLYLLVGKVIFESNLMPFDTNYLAMTLQNLDDLFCLLSSDTESASPYAEVLLTHA